MTEAPAPPFEPRLALASLSGRSDAEWARSGSEFAGAAFLGGIALDEPTREAARRMVDRDREEFLPADPLSFVDDQLAALADAPLRPGFNVRASEPEPIRAAAEVCADRGAMLEVNAHCRQDEMCAAGAGESLLGEPARLADYVAAAAATGATVSVKVRTELASVDLPAVAARLDDAGVDIVHVDAMDSEEVVADVVEATDVFVVANNGVRDRETVREYLAHGADAVSVGRPSDDPRALRRVRAAVDEWFDGDAGDESSGDAGDGSHGRAVPAGSGGPKS
ncbi:dihydropyrimidine dehydrogenase [Halosimplex carlsbadense 2-9-1]|uniref:Dihydropyrimidine dehydrogenase n=1 Tax=Halosimplex carlsbadense 2-9-1 TaxID=797114 RepID=M0CQV8_9EURY|nr:tRNA-dihydrouridine synthase [Halosimplex carlsbadense]ELZ25640.1 dihydropyrimidine dehydrogenase [Halosimplex carlsbadense 2-9-1]